MNELEISPKQQLTEHQTERTTLNFTNSGATMDSEDSSLIHTDESVPVYPDDSGSSLKATRIDKFLWMRKLLMLGIFFSVSISLVFAQFMSLPKIHRTDEGPGAGKIGRLEDGGRVLVGEFGVYVEDVESSPRLLLKFPKDMGELRVIRAALEVYQKEHRTQVQIGIVCFYLFLQTFMIPGSTFINVLAGSLYGFYEALLLVLVLHLFSCLSLPFSNFFSLVH